MIDPTRTGTPSPTRAPSGRLPEAPLPAPAPRVEPAPAPVDRTLIPAPAGSPTRLSLAGQNPTVSSAIARAGGVQAARLESQHGSLGG